VVALLDDVADDDAPGEETGVLVVAVVDDVFGCSVGAAASIGLLAKASHERVVATSDTASAIKMFRLRTMSQSSLGFDKRTLSADVD